MQALVPKLFSSPLKKISNPQNFSRNDLSTGTLTHSLTRECIENAILSFFESEAVNFRYNHRFWFHEIPLARVKFFNMTERRECAINGPELGIPCKFSPISGS
ncbi:hypothetical protein NC651_027196 [Populus alba x Populus x berolinensis]|nr:hypothetical protein NC651_027196 [Populus alba x Populus x berolinensis]